MEVHPRLISNPTVSDWRAKVNHASARNTALSGIVPTPLPGAGCAENRYHLLRFMF